MNNLFTAKTVHLKVESYRSSNVPQKDLEVVRHRAASSLESFKRYALVSDAKDADLVIEVAFASDYVYGMYRSQSAPTVFLQIRDRVSGTPLYCASGRAGFMTSATKNAFRDLRHKIETLDPSLNQHLSMNSCSSLT